MKEIVFDETLQTEVALDTTLTPELKDEGQFRELSRFVQDMRKKLGLSPGDKAALEIKAGGASVRFIEQYGQELSKIANLRNVSHVSEFTHTDSTFLIKPFQADEIALELRLSKD